MHRRAAIDKRVSDDRALARRRWVFRMVSFVSITAVILCFIVAWRRDTLVVGNQIRALSEAVTGIQATLDEIGRLPAEVPGLRHTPLAYYATDAERYYAINVDAPVILAAMPRISLLLGEDGHAVIVHEQGEVRAEWMSATDYERAKRRQDQEIEAFERQRSKQPLILP